MHTLDPVEPERQIARTAPRPPTSRWHQSLPFRLVLGAAGALVLELAFPSVGWWPLALVGAAMIIGALDRQSLPRGMLIGFVSGMTFYLVHISWASLYLGPIPWIALATTQALIYAVIGGLWSWSTRLLAARHSGTTTRYVAYPVLVAAWWLVRETVTSAWPYGGFSWARLSFSQSEGWFAESLSWLGAAGLSFALAGIAAVAYQSTKGLCTWVKSRRIRRIDGEVELASKSARLSKRHHAPALLGAAWVTVVLTVALVPVFPQTPEGTLRIGAVQGAGPAGYFSERHRGDLLQAQLDATAEFITEPVDLIVWPEDGTDIDPMRDSATRDVFTKLTTELDAPIIFGTATRRADLSYNSSLVWPVGALEPSAIYDKLHPVPFGEYIPHRGFYSRIVPDLIGLVRRDYQAGQHSPVMPVANARIGAAICFDIAYDDVTQRIVREGGQVIVAQSNNGDFGRTDESAQQLAIARVRAIESGREVVNISTVGISAIIRADGSTAAELPWFEPGAMVEDVTLYTATTPAMVVSPVIVWGSAILAFGTLAVLVWRTRSRRTAI